MIWIIALLVAHSRASLASVETCKQVVVGAGWGGTYFAWRLSVDSGIWPSESTCIFEATNAIGGRAYSKNNIPGLSPDIRVDLGAYRFDKVSHPLVNHVIIDVLKLPTRCYDVDGTCTPSGQMHIIRDKAYGINAGYASGSEGLAALFEKQGGKIFKRYRLTAIEETGSETKPIRLTFSTKGGAVVVADVATVFLNLPALAIQDIWNETSALFQKASEQTKTALKFPQQMPGLKQFLIYPSTPWRNYPELLTGNIKYDSLPPINGRLHDFHGVCNEGGSQGSDCSGAVMTYYDFPTIDDPSNTAYLDYYAKFQRSLEDPYTYIPWNQNSKIPENQKMMEEAHKNFIEALAARNVSGFNTTDEIARALPYPTGTVIVVWWGRDPASNIRPAPSVIWNMSSPLMSDPGHLIRNRVSKPFNDLPIYLANEAFSGGDGWAEPSLEMTERIIFHHFGHTVPKWVSERCEPFTLPTPNCVSATWWNQLITADPPDFNLPFIANCPANTPGIPQPVNGQCEGETPTPCISSQPFSGIFNVSWVWIDSVNISFTVQAKTEGWLGLGFGNSMAAADMVVARVLTDGTVDVKHYSSTSHSRPTELDARTFATDLSGFYAADTRLLTLKFMRPAKFDSFNEISKSGPTSILLAVYQGSLEDPKSFPQHTKMYATQLDVSCSAPILVGFVEDILPLFRQQDIDAMKFAMDLSNYDDVYSNRYEIFKRLQEKTFLDLPTGMPKDAPWTLVQLQVFQKWLLTEAPKSRGGHESTFCKNKDLTFWHDIKPLFRAQDRDAMVHWGDFWDYNFVKTHATTILAAVRDGIMIGGVRSPMPCDGKWSDDKIDVLDTWINCGMPQGDPGEDVDIDREIFYQAMNIEQNPEYLPKAKRALRKYLDDAKQNGQPEKAVGDLAYRLYTKYSPSTFETLLNGIYNSHLADFHNYNPATDSNFTEYVQVKNRIVQLAPFNLVDGAWIAHCCPTGPTDEVHAMLWGILNDEMGSGNVAWNHCKVFDDLLKSLGVNFPAVNTRAFAYDSNLLPSAFTQPAYAIVLALFSDSFFPELLGTTLQIEWNVLDLVHTQMLLDYWGIDSSFYKLHIGIDNAAKGHGYRAKRAIEIYLDEVAARDGEAGVQAAWERIWTGYLAFDSLGTLFQDISAQNQQLVTYSKTPVDNVLKLIENKSIYGSMNHREKQLGAAKINSLFADPQAFLATLSSSAWVVPGHPEDSALLDYLATPSGPMFKVFDDDELGIWRTWITSLGGHEHAPANAKLDSYEGMRQVVIRMMKLATSVEAHRFVSLWGPSPDDGQDVELSVHSWLDTVDQSPDYLMAALKHAKNNKIECGHPERSSFIISLLSPHTVMGKRFDKTATHLQPTKTDPHQSTHWTWKDIVTLWVADGCPMKQQPGHTRSFFPSAREVKPSKKRKHISFKHLESGRHFVH